MACLKVAWPVLMLTWMWCNSRWNCWRLAVSIIFKLTVFLIVVVVVEGTVFWLSWLCVAPDKFCTFWIVVSSVYLFGKNGDQVLMSGLAWPTFDDHVSMFGPAFATNRISVPIIFLYFVIFLQTKYTSVMRDKADLLDKMDQMEHVMLQLQGESETIGQFPLISSPWSFPLDQFPLISSPWSFPFDQFPFDHQFLFDQFPLISSPWSFPLWSIPLWSVPHWSIPLRSVPSISSCIVFNLTETIN